MIDFKVLNRYSGEVQFTAEIDCKETETESIKLGLAVRWAVKNKTNLQGANLQGVDLQDADLRYIDMQGVNLQGADLRYVDLREANLQDANLRYIDMQGANLRDADLRYVDLQGANLRDVDLSGVALREANLRDVNLDKKDIDKIDFQICPMQGSFQAWKKLADNHIALVEIPAKAKRTSNLKGRKCRASYVKTLKIYKGNKLIKTVVSGRHDSKTTYKAGTITRADKYDDDARLECTNGIHFFMTRKEAEEW